MNTMQVNLVDEEVPGFKPVRLNFVLTSQNQINALYALFNLRSNCEVLREFGIDGAEVRKALEKGSIEEITYRDAHTKLRDA